MFKWLKNKLGITSLEENYKYLHIDPRAVFDL